jgi:hypothetical protein
MRQYIGWCIADIRRLLHAVYVNRMTKGVAIVAGKGQMSGEIFYFFGGNMRLISSTEVNEVSGAMVGGDVTDGGVPLLAVKNPENCAGRVESGMGMGGTGGGLVGVAVGGALGGPLGAAVGGLLGTGGGILGGGAVAANNSPGCESTSAAAVGYQASGGAGTPSTGTADGP